jgi:hypothetical protein
MLKPWQLIGSTLMVILMTGCATVSATLSNRVDHFGFDLQIIDEAGRPIPYVQVLLSTYPCNSPDGPIGHQNTCSSAEQLQDLVIRLRDSLDFVLPGNQPGEGFSVLPLADASGRFAWSRSFQFINGGTRQLPHAFTASLVLFKRGYLPATTVSEFTALRHSSSGTVVLKRDPNREPDKSPYAQTIDHARYELSDTHRNNEISAANQTRLAKVKSDLQAATEAAEAVNDRDVAARGYFRLAFMPSVQSASSGQLNIVGYSSGDLGSAMASSQWKKVRELVPENPWVKAQMFLPRYQAFPNSGKHDLGMEIHPDEIKGIEALSNEHYQWANENFDRLWPRHAGNIAGVLRSVRRYDTAYNWIQRMSQAGLTQEVKWSLDALKRTMERRKLPWPKEWAQ